MTNQTIIQTEAHILASVMENTRSLTRWYLSLLKEQDPHKVFTLSDGTALNTVHWLSCHIAWAENSLLLMATGGKAVEIPWLEKYGIGAKAIDPESPQPSMKEVLHAMKEIHEAALSHIKSLTSQQLDETNLMGIGFGGDNSKRMMIHHTIRHESCHTGQLGWLCKFYGLKTI